MSDIPTIPDPGHALSAEELENFRQRLGDTALRNRLDMQVKLWARLLHQDEGGPLNLRRFFPVDATIAWALRLAGLYGRGNRNFRDVRLVENTVWLERLPAAFDGFRLLQVTDLHLDLDESLTPVVVDQLRKLQGHYDLAVVTGDYRDSTSDHHGDAVRETLAVVDALQTPAYAIMGNHDFLEMVPPLEAAGLTFLINETTAIHRDGETIYLAGIDDPVFYQTHDLAKTRREIPGDACAIMLSHGPVTYAAVEAAGFDFMLSGHTHGGQICLPGGIALIRNGHCPPEIAVGPWRWNRLAGYTSRGTGACGVAVRFNCPPEITLHHLRRGKQPSH